MQFVARLDFDAYKAVCKDIVTDEVIITDKQIAHILEKHSDEEHQNVLTRLAETVSEPDYILRDSHEEHECDTAIAMKYFDSDDGGYRAVVRLATATDDHGYKNSVITALFISKKKWKKYLRNKTILYKRG